MEERGRGNREEEESERWNREGDERELRWSR